MATWHVCKVWLWIGTTHCMLRSQSCQPHDIIQTDFPPCSVVQVSLLLFFATSPASCELIQHRQWTSFFLLINQLDAQFFFSFTVSLFHACTCFEHHVLIVRRSELYYTASGIIKPIGGRPVHGTATYRYDDTRGCIIQFWPPDDEHMVLETCRGMK